MSFQSGILEMTYVVPLPSFLPWKDMEIPWETTTFTNNIYRLTEQPAHIMFKSSPKLQDIFMSSQVRFYSYYKLWIFINNTVNPDVFCHLVTIDIYIYMWSALQVTNFSKHCYNMYFETHIFACSYFKHCWIFQEYQKARVDLQS